MAPKRVSSLVKKWGLTINKWDKPEYNCYGVYELSNDNTRITIWYSLGNEVDFYKDGKYQQIKTESLSDSVRVIDEFLEEVSKTDDKNKGESTDEI